MPRVIRFLVEVLAGILLAGLLLGATIPLLHNYLEPLPQTFFHILALAVLVACVLAAALRPGGSLRG